MYDANQEIKVQLPEGEFSVNLHDVLDAAVREGKIPIEKLIEKAKQERQGRLSEIAEESKDSNSEHDKDGEMFDGGQPEEFMIPVVDHGP